MLNLMRLEWKKLRIRKYAWNAALTTLVLAFWCATNIPDEDTQTYAEVFIAINSYVRSSFIVFSSVLMSRMIIDEYRNKTISVLFMYPVNRFKLLTAKLLLLSLLTFSVILAADVVVLTLFLLVDSRYDYIPEAFQLRMLAPGVGSMILYAAASTGLSLVPLFAGMLRKSVPATLVASFVLAMGLTGVHYEYGAKLYLFALSLIAFGVLMAYLAIRNVERDDLVG